MPSGNCTVFIFYLQNVCGLYMVIEKLENDLDNLEDKLEYLQGDHTSLLQKRKKYLAEISKACNLLDEMYDINVIPCHYRNKYAALALYTFFKANCSDASEQDLCAPCLNDEAKEKMYQVCKTVRAYLISAEEFTK